MTLITAHARNIRQSARKVRLVVGIIRGMSVSGALAQLSVMTKAARVPVEKLLRSAIANAENNFQKNSADLFIKEVQVNQGAPLKRWRPRAFGRAAPLKKHSCHISIVLDEVAGASHTGKPVKGTNAPVVETLEGVVEKQGDTHAHVSSSVKSDTVSKRSAPFDKSRAGRHETSQRITKEKKVSALKKIIQRKTGS